MKVFFFKVFESYRKLTYGSGIQVGADSYKINKYKKTLKNVFFKVVFESYRKLTLGPVSKDSYK